MATSQGKGYGTQSNSDQSLIVYGVLLICLLSGDASRRHQSSYLQWAWGKTGYGWFCLYIIKSAPARMY